MPTFDCLDCSRRSQTASALLNHCDTAGHDFGCKQCNKIFYSTRSLEQHIRDSPAHPPESRKQVSRKKPPPSKGNKIKCLFCNRKFKTPSAIAMHIESGRHKITRHQVTAAVHKLGIVPTISVDRRLLGPILPPTTMVTYSATHLAFNGTAYECSFCHGTFKKLKSLNSHLNSPVHDDDEFKCPSAKCGHEFKLVSGLIQHIECGTCGLATRNEVQANFESLTEQFSRDLKF